MAISTIAGYPALTRPRTEMGHERYWSGKIDAAVCSKPERSIAPRTGRSARPGIDLVAINDFTFYDRCSI